MKVNELKNLIKEAVKEAIREELNAVQEPVQEIVAPIATPPKKTGNAITDTLNETMFNMTREDYRSITGANSSMAQSFSRDMFIPKRNTRPVSTDPNVVAQAVAHAPKVGIDLSQLNFVNKASAIVKVSNEKDKGKNGF